MLRQVSILIYFAFFCASGKLSFDNLINKESVFSDVDKMFQEFQLKHLKVNKADLARNKISKEVKYINVFTGVFGEVVLNIFRILSVPYSILALQFVSGCQLLGIFALIKLLTTLPLIVIRAIFCDFGTSESILCGAYEVFYLTYSSFASLFRSIYEKKCN